MALIEAVKKIESISQNRDLNAFHQLLTSGKLAVSPIQTALNLLTERIYGEV